MPETHESNSQLPEVLAALGTELDRSFEHAEMLSRISTTPAAQPRRRTRRAYAISFAVAACAAVALVFALNVGLNGTDLGTEEALGDIAHRIELSPQPQPDQFQFTKSRASNFGVIDGGLDQMARPYETFVYSQSNDSEWWISSTKEGRGRFKGGVLTYPSEQDRKNGEQYFSAFDEHAELMKTPEGRVRLRDINREIMKFQRERGITGTIGVSGTEWEEATFDPGGVVLFGGETLTPEQVDSYPREPKAMLSRMLAAAQNEQRSMEAASAEMAKTAPGQTILVPDVDSLVWSYLTAVGNDVPIPADLRAARVRALALLPGVEAAGSGTDAYGRKGDRFAWEINGERNELLFDEKNASLLMSRTVVTDPTALRHEVLRRLPAGFELSEYQLIEQETLDRLPAN